MEEINIRDFLRYFKKFIGIIVGVIILCLVVVGIYDILFKKPMYSTYTTIVLVKDEKSSDVSSSDSINQNDITLNQKLVSTYRQIIKSKLVVEQVISSLNINYSYSELSKEINVDALEDTEILKLSVTDSDPKRAANIANSLATVFEAEITKIYKINNVSIIDTAQVNENPSNNTLIRDLVLAIMVGFVATSAVIFIIYYFDDTLRFTESIESDIEMPVIAKVYKDNSGIDLIVEKKPKSSTSESIRTLRTNLQFSSIDNETRTILVTSTIAGEGKSFICANLATSFAQAGKKVLLIDCDLRKGRQHKIFKISSKKGLSNLLLKDIKEFPEYIYQSKIENLSVIPRGVFPPNPSELLGSKKMISAIELFKKYFDIIILDGVPSNGLSDSLILSSLVDRVLLVSSVNYTPKTELKNTRKALENVGANIAGCVVNNINPRKDTYGSYYAYNYGYGVEK